MKWQYQAPTAPEERTDAVEHRDRADEPATVPEEPGSGLEVALSQVTKPQPLDLPCPDCGRVARAAELGPGSWRWRHPAIVEGDGGKPCTFLGIDATSFVALCDSWFGWRGRRDAKEAAGNPEAEKVSA